MGMILAVGNVTLDIINLVDDYPKEDQEVRARSQQFRRGGNTCNTLVVLSQLGHQCSWAGTLTNEPDAAMIIQDLDTHNIDRSAVHTTAHGKVPTSYVSLSRATGSRTIVHYRDLPEYAFSDFCQIDLTPFDWLHFEGRNLGEVAQMMALVRQHNPALPISLEVEKPRPEIEQLFGLADLILFSKEYAKYTGFDDAQKFLQHMANRYPNTTMSCTWGDKGASAINEKGELFSIPPFFPEKVVDTLGAGDTFNAGMIDGLVRGEVLETALGDASQLAGKKCGQYGLNGLVDKTE